MVKPTSGKIVDWDSRRGFGFVSHEGERVFLHIRDCVGRHHAPRVGEPVAFRLGQDEKGRVCAKDARFTRASSRLRFGQVAALGLLLVLPTLAVLELPCHPGISISVWATLSLISWCLYASDKKRAARGAWRISEAALHFWDLIGGWPGGFLAQRNYRHKTAKAWFQLVFWSTVIAYQVVAFEYLNEWSLWSALYDMIKANASVN